MTPTTIECAFCGKALKARTKEFAGTEVYLGTEPCDCPESVADRERIEREERERMEANRKALEERRLSKAGIPKRYRDCSHPKALSLAEAVKDGRWAYIHGGNGTLKSTLAYAVAAILLSQGKRVRCMSSYDLMDAMRAPSEADRAMYDQAREVDFLILDDLGKEATASEYACERLFSIIDARSKEMRPTVITSNLKLSELANGIPVNGVGVAIASRIREDAAMVEMTGKDRRLAC